MVTTPPSDQDDWIVARIPRHFQQQLPSEVNAALADISPKPWRKHPVDIRLSIPFMGFFITIVAGPERRSAERRAADRRRHRLASIGNALFMLVFVGVFYAVIIGAAMLLTAALG